MTKSAALVENGWTLKEAGQRFGISGQRASQLEQSAMSKIRLLIFATEDFPLLHEVFKEKLAKMVEQDIKRDRAITARHREDCRKARRRKVAR